MGTDILQARYDGLDQVAQRFDQAAFASHALQLRIVGSVEPLATGGWRGEAAQRFLAEMQSEIFPALHRLSEAFATASATTRQLKESIQAAEREAAGLFGQGEAQSPPASSGPSASSSPGVFDSILSGVGDFFGGMFAEGKDMVTGLVHMVTDPVGTATGLWYGVTHPGELWDALKQPYVEAWQSGHPWTAIGRGTVFVASFLIGAKGADKISAAAKASRAAEVSADAAAAAARTGSSVNAAREIGLVAKGSRAEAGLARYIAEQSTHTFHDVDRVVLGGFEPKPARGFLGYVKEAETHGGKVFSTDLNDAAQPVWKHLKANGHGEQVNMQFLQKELERGTPISLQGNTIAELRKSEGFLSNTARAQEVKYLRAHAYEYGYKQIGNAWEKVGPWRASTSGRAIGGAVTGAAGATGELVEATHRR